MNNSHPYFPLYTGKLQLRKNNSWQLFYTYTRVIIKGENMKDKDLLKLLLKNGWKDVPTGLLNTILKRTGLK